MFEHSTGKRAGLVRKFQEKTGLKETEDLVDKKGIRETIRAG